MAGEETAARPTSPAASVAFLVGTAGWPDGFLSQGKKWAKAIQTAAGGAPGVQVGDLGKDPVAVADAIRRFAQTGATAAVPVAKLDANLGGLRGHTVVFVTHGLEPHDPSLTAQQKKDTQGLLFYNAGKGDNPNDKVFFRQHLDFMKLEPVPGGAPGEQRVVTKPELDTLDDSGDGKQFKKDAHAYVQVVDALRRSIFRQIYLAACGPNRRLDDFAAKLFELTGLVVWWNEDTISFPTPPDAPFAEVGPIVGGKTSPLRKGTRFFKAEKPENLVDLRSKTDGFLEGAMKRQVGP